MVARGGWSIEPAVMDGRACWRVRRFGALLDGGRGDCWSLPEVAALLGPYGIGLADFDEEDLDCE